MSRHDTPPLPCTRPMTFGNQRARSAATSIAGRPHAGNRERARRLRRQASALIVRIDASVEMVRRSIARGEA